MKATNNTKLFHELGMVAVYSAYLEDTLAKVVKLFSRIITLEKKIKSYQLASQAKNLKKSLEKNGYSDQDFLDLLDEIEKKSNERNKFIHTLIKAGKSDEELLQISQSGAVKISVEDVHKLAIEILKLDRDLTQYLPSIRDYVRECEKIMYIEIFLKLKSINQLLILFINLM